MCGIVGSFTPGRTGSGADIVARMRDRMAHRGPDGVGIWCARDRGCTLGHRRLSIIDLSPRRRSRWSTTTARLPSPSTARSTTTRRFARELEALGKYRWRTDHSDTEMLLHAYEEWGLDCVKRFYGMFAIAIYDAREPGRPVAAPDPRPRRHQAALLHEDGGRRVAVRVRDPRAARASRRHAGDGSHRVLALPDVHRHARAADDVPRHLQAAGGPRVTIDSRRRGERDSSGGTAGPTPQHR